LEELVDYGLLHQVNRLQATHITFGTLQNLTPPSRASGDGTFFGWPENRAGYVVNNLPTGYRPPSLYASFE
jgi:hypothetical protein